MHREKDLKHYVLLLDVSRICPFHQQMPPTHTSPCTKEIFHILGTSNVCLLSFSVIFGLYANESLQYVQKEELDALVLATEGHVPPELSDLFRDVSHSFSLAQMLDLTTLLNATRQM